MRPGGRRRSIVVLVVASALVPGVAACTGDDDTTPTSSTTPVTDSRPTTTTSLPPSPVSVARAYASAIADPAVPGAEVAVGDALQYLDHRRLSAEILGTPIAVLPGETEHQICTDGGCASITAVAVDPGTGRVATLDVDGQPIAGRIAGSGLIADDGGIVAQTRTAYVTNGGRLAVTVEVSNTTEVDLELFDFAAVLRPADASAGVEAAGGWGEVMVPAGGETILLLVFDVDRLGGRIGLRGLLADGLDVALDIDVPEAP